MVKRYRVTLTEDEKVFLDGLTKKGTQSARTIILSRALLLCGAGWTSQDISDALGITCRTIEHLKKRFVEEGLEASINRKARETPPRGVRFDGEFEARLIALACSGPPTGRDRWTVRLLAEKVVELQIVESISHTSVQRVLKKTNLSLISRNTGKSRQKRMRLS